MVKTIALCCSENVVRTTVTLIRIANVKVFNDGIELAYYLKENDDCQLAVIAVDGAKGMNYCTYVRGQNSKIPILWISDKEEYEEKAAKIPVNDFWVKPMPEMLLEKMAAELLK